MLDTATMELLKLTGDIDLEEEIMVSAGDEDDSVEDDEEEGWIDKHDEMTEAELSELVISVQPVRLLLTKVRNQLHDILLSNHPFPAVKGCVHYKKLDNHYLTTMVFNPQQS